MRRLMTITIVAAVLLTGMNISAQETKQDKLAEELLILMDVQSNIEQAFSAVTKMQTAQFQSMDMPEEGKEAAISSQKKIMDFLAQEMSWDKLKADYIRIYSDTFTAEEIQGVIDFYKTPIGQKFIEKQPEIMEKSMQISQKQMMSIMPKIQKLTMEMIKEGQGSAPKPYERMELDEADDIE